LQLFKLVHTDIWGPSIVKNPKEFQHFVIFIDVCFRMTWLYLMKERSEFPYMHPPFIMKSMFSLINTLKFYVLIKLWSILNHL